MRHALRFAEVAVAIGSCQTAGCAAGSAAHGAPLERRAAPAPPLGALRGANELGQAAGQVP